MKKPLIILLAMILGALSIPDIAKAHQNDEPKTVVMNVVSQQGNLEIKGRVTTADGEGLPGVNIVVKGTNNGTITDLDGYFVIECNEGDTLIFSYLGFDSEEVEAKEGLIIVQLKETPPSKN